MSLEKAGSGSVRGEAFNAVVDELEGHGGRFVTAADVDSQAAQDGDVLTADGAGGASWEAGGGSQPGVPVEYAKVIDFDDPDILTGVTLWEGDADNRMARMSINVLTTFDGTTPTAFVGILGETLDDGTDAYISATLGSVDPYYDDSANLHNVKEPSGSGGTEGLYFTAPGTLVLLVSDGSGGSPGVMTQGQLRVRYQIIEQPATPPS